jgi:hypothetical protein
MIPYQTWYENVGPSLRDIYRTFIAPNAVTARITFDEFCRRSYRICGRTR